MSKNKNIFIKLINMLLIVLFIPLSYLKFFTLKINFTTGLTESIVRTDSIQLLLNSKLFTDETYPHNWHELNNFDILYSNEATGIHGFYYNILIFFWWILLIYFITQIIKVLANKKK